jgi:16S rRNA (cytosine967-C5)-methyltransferase
MLVTGPAMRTISPSRRAAFEVPDQVAGGGYASDTLRAITASISSRDAGLTSQIVFGCLRFQAQIDYLIWHYSGKRAENLDLPVKLALRMAIFQLRYLERIPAHAAVHDSVELVKVHCRAAVGFANAVLRKVNRDPVRWPDVATELSCPAWLLDCWTEHFGADASRSIARAALEEPAPYIRISPGSLLLPGMEGEPTDIPGAFRLLSPAHGDIRLHDISSQAMLPLLDLRPGHTFLDLCAAPGNKTQQALETPLQLAVACDISERRIREIPDRCPRVVLDATQPLPFAMQFDRVFVDAPCSGTGTLGRNPEIKWRIQPDEFRRFSERQAQILARAAEAVRPGGKILYATCSLEHEENEDVVEGALLHSVHLRCDRTLWRRPGREPGDGFFAAVLSAC